MDQLTSIGDECQNGIEDREALPDTHEADVCLDRLLNDFKKSKSPLQVNFRKMVNWVQYGERSSHMIHLYPAKLLPHIPILFLSNNILSSKGDVVFDPFCGSGTVILEALLSKRSAIGADSNPLARLISKVKTTPINKTKLNLEYKNLCQRLQNSSPTFDYPDVVNIDYWFHPHVKDQLNHLKKCIESTRSPEVRDFFKVTFSNTIKRVSLADPLVSVPVKLRKDKHPQDSLRYQQTKKLIKKLSTVDVYDVFHQLAESNIKRINIYTKSVGMEINSPNIFRDARCLSDGDFSQGDETVQIVITSPPYSGAQKYIRSSGLSLGWLGICKSNELRVYEKQNIGREHYSKAEYSKLPSTGVACADKLLMEIFGIYPLRAHISANYLVEMSDAFREAHRVLKYQGYFVLVIANNRVCGKEFLTQKYLRILMESYGFEIELCLIDDILSRGLMTKRNKAANVIVSEWIMVFRKVRGYV